MAAPEPDLSYPAGSVRALLDSSHVTAPTRRVLQARLVQAQVSTPRFFDAGELATLRAACARLLGQAEMQDTQGMQGTQDTRGRLHIDMAGAIDTRLAAGTGDGWRHDAMPPDGLAHRLGLRGLDASARARSGGAFCSLTPREQDAVLTAVQRGEVDEEPWKFVDPARFFEELLAGAAEAFYAHPLAMEDIGCVAMADAGGWSPIGLNQLAAHEPRPSPAPDAV